MLNQPSPDDGGELLAKWEEVYKKGLLSFWMLLILHQRPTYAFEMNALIQQIAQASISADDNSLYRALNRFEALGITASELVPSPQGPARRYYRLTAKGSRLLADFIRRNILVFQEPQVVEKIQAALADPQEEER